MGFVEDKPSELSCEFMDAMSRPTTENPAALIKQIRDKGMKVCDVVLTVVIYWPSPCHSPSPFVIPHSLIFICSPVISQHGLSAVDLVYQ